jgi:hypothetical protein
VTRQLGAMSSVETTSVVFDVFGSDGVIVDDEDDRPMIRVYRINRR